VTATPALVHRRLTEFSQQRSFDVLLELFASLGYQYADELPLPVSNWPDGVRSYLQENAEPPIYLAQHRDFHVIYTHLRTDDLLRTVERPIVEHTLRKLHPFALFVFANRDLTRWDFINVKYVAESITLSEVEGLHPEPVEGLSRVEGLHPEPVEGLSRVEGLHPEPVDILSLSKG